MLLYAPDEIAAQLPEHWRNLPILALVDDWDAVDAVSGTLMLWIPKSYCHLVGNKVAVWLAQGPRWAWLEVTDATTVREPEEDYDLAVLLLGEAGLVVEKAHQLEAFTLI